jgi:HlyD family secretion protein
VRKTASVRWLVIVGVLLLIGGGVAAYFKSKGGEKAAAVTTDKAVSRTITQLVNATGKIQPEVEVKIAPEVSGEIVDLPLREGAVVKKGDLLVRIKPENYQYQLDQREADLAAYRAMAVQSKAQLQKLVEDHKRNQNLFEQKLLSDSDFAASKASVEAAQAGYENAQARNPPR